MWVEREGIRRGSGKGLKGNLILIITMIYKSVTTAELADLLQVEEQLVVNPN